MYLNLLLESTEAHPQSSFSFRLLTHKCTPAPTTEKKEEEKYCYCYNNNRKGKGENINRSSDTNCTRLL